MSKRENPGVTGNSLNFLQPPACLSFLKGDVEMLYHLLDVDMPFEWLNHQLRLILLLLVLELLLLYPQLVFFIKSATVTNKIWMRLVL